SAKQSIGGIHNKALVSKLGCHVIVTGVSFDQGLWNAISPMLNDYHRSFFAFFKIFGNKQYARSNKTFIYIQKYLIPCPKFFVIYFAGTWIWRQVRFFKFSQNLFPKVVAVLFPFLHKMIRRKVLMVTFGAPK